MKKTISAIYFVLLGVGCVLMLSCIFMADTKVTSTLQEYATEQEVTPYTVNQIDEDVREFYLKVDEVTNSGTCLSFYTNHSNVYVYENDVLVYSVEAQESIFGTTAGARWNFVNLEYGTTDVMVRIEASYPRVRAVNVDFYLGSAYYLALNTMRSSVWEIIVSVLDMFVGIVLLVYWFLTKKKGLAGKGVFGLGLFAVMMGLWSFIEAEMTSILITNRVAASFCGYTLIMLMIMPFTMFLQEYLEVKKEIFARVLCIVSLVNYVVCTVLHMTGIKAFKETVIGTHSLMFCTLIFLGYVLIQRIRDVGFDRKVRTNMAGVMMLTISFLADMVAFYTGMKRTDLLGRLGFFLYICILGKAVAVEAIASIEEGRKAEIYKELAVRDILTNLYNRNAYDKWVQESPEEKGTAIVTFDLNDLKHCNDTLGHAAGDRYIQHAAMLITTAFEPEAKCFRIGGDEFCAVLVNTDEETIRSKINELEQLEYEYNRNFAVVEIRIAHGYAMYDAAEDVDIEATRQRADERMYANKKILKAKTRI